MDRVVFLNISNFILGWISFIFFFSLFFGLLSYALALPKKNKIKISKSKKIIFYSLIILIIIAFIYPILFPVAPPVKS